MARSPARDIAKPLMIRGRRSAVMKLGNTRDQNRLGCKLRTGLHLSSAGHLGAGRINDRYFDRLRTGDAMAAGLLSSVASAEELR
jgi:hypothetical protein